MSNVPAQPAASDSNSADRFSKIGTPLVVAAVVVAVLMHVAVNGYAFGGCTDRPLVTSPSSDHANILPWVHWYQDHALYRHDLEIQSNARYATVLWPAVAALARVVPLEWTFFLLHLLCLTATYFLLFLIGRQLAACDAAGLLACLFFLVARDGPAGESTHDAAFYTRGAALPLALWSIWLGLRGRGIAAFVALAGTVAIHSLTAFYVAPLLTIFWCASPGLTRAARLIPVGMGMVLSFFVAWLIGGDQAAWLGPPSQEWLNLQRGNNAMHVFPRMWGHAVWHDLAVCGLFLVVALRGGVALPSSRLAWAALVSGALLTGLGRLTTEVSPSMLFMQLQPLRGLKFTILASLLCAASLIARSNGTWKVAAAAVCMVGLCARQEWVIALGVVSLALLPAGTTPWRKTRLGTAGAALTCVLCAAGVASQAIQRSDQKWVYAPNLDLPFVARDSAWIEVQRWVQAHTPRDALLLTPPILEGFRTYARRSEFADWKQGTLSMFHEAFGVEWQRRLSRLVRRPMHARAVVNLALNYDALTAADLTALAREYGITHAVVMHRRDEFPWSQVYDNGVFRVLARP